MDNQHQPYLFIIIVAINRPLLRSNHQLIKSLVTIDQHIATTINNFYSPIVTIKFSLLIVSHHPSSSLTIICWPSLAMVVPSLTIYNYNHQLSIIINHQPLTQISPSLSIMFKTLLVSLSSSTTIFTLKQFLTTDHSPLFTIFCSETLRRQGRDASHASAASALQPPEVAWPNDRDRRSRAASLAVNQRRTFVHYVVSK